MFKEGFFYLSDSAGNISGPYYTKAFAIEQAVEGDFLLQVHKLEENKKKPQKIVLDFKKEEIIIYSKQPLEVTLNKCTYSSGTSPMDKEEDWYMLLMDANKVCKDVEVVGTPPIAGDKLL